MRKLICLFIYLLSIMALPAQTGNTTWIAAGTQPESLHLSVPTLVNTKAAEMSDYTQGTFIVNEDWYGHQNSTVNFLTSGGDWIYRVFQKENDGHELGCTTQFGTIYGGKFYLVSKQQKDPGAKITGSRFAICDAKTMKVIKEFQFIASKSIKGSTGQDSTVSIADGRSYLPVDEHKGYIGTSNGIWVYNSDNMTVGKQIEGTGNPNASGYGQLYYAQIGTMIRANDLVFAIHQQNGLLIIDPATDRIVRTIAAPVERDTVNGKAKDVQRGFGSIVRAKDGNLWISMTRNVMGDGAAIPYLLKMNPCTLHADTLRIPLEKGIGMVPNSWYAWTADGFCASKQENKLYWNGQDNRGSWFTGYQIYSYDIDHNRFSLVSDITKMPGNWRLYGTGFRIHPVTDELYCFLYHEFSDPTHEIARLRSDGKLLKEYPMIVNYWFPALPVFPDNEDPVVSSVFPETLELTEKHPVGELRLTNLVSDADNLDVAIVKSVEAVSPESPFKAVIRNDSLIVTSSASLLERHEATVSLRFNSNGQIVTRNLIVRSGVTTDAPKVEHQMLAFYPNPASDRICLNNDTPAKVTFYALGGQNILSTTATPGEAIDISRIPGGVYVVCVVTREKTEVLKVIKK